MNRSRSGMSFFVGSSSQLKSGGVQPPVFCTGNAAPGDAAAVSSFTNCTSTTWTPVQGSVTAALLLCGDGVSAVVTSRAVAEDVALESETQARCIEPQTALNAMGAQPSILLFVHRKFVY